MIERFAGRPNWRQDIKASQLGIIYACWMKTHSIWDSSDASKRPSPEILEECGRAVAGGCTSSARCKRRVKRDDRLLVLFSVIDGQMLSEGTYAAHARPGDLDTSVRHRALLTSAPSTTEVERSSGPPSPSA